eukprot:365082-Chlamydomonas_euryale.AAC.12
MHSHALPGVVLNPIQPHPMVGRRPKIRPSQPLFWCPRPHPMLVAWPRSGPHNHSCGALQPKLGPPSSGPHKHGRGIHPTQPGRASSHRTRAPPAPRPRHTPSTPARP